MAYRLEYLARRVAETRGLVHLAALRALRDYIKKASREWLITQIMRIKRFDLLRALWEAGRPVELQEAVLKR